MPETCVLPILLICSNKAVCFEVGQLGDSQVQYESAEFLVSDPLIACDVQFQKTKTNRRNAQATP